MFNELLESPALKRNGRGRPRKRPRRVVGDQGYTSQHIRRYLHQRGSLMTIPLRSNERNPNRYNRAIYKSRNQVERLINRFKQFRRLATSYEKRAENYQARWLIGAILLWLLTLHKRPSEILWWFALLPPEKLNFSQLHTLNKLCQCGAKLDITYQYAQDFKRVFEVRRVDQLED